MSDVITKSRTEVIQDAKFTERLSQTASNNFFGVLALIIGVVVMLCFKFVGAGMKFIIPFAILVAIIAGLFLAYQYIAAWIIAIDATMWFYILFAIGIIATIILVPICVYLYFRKTPTTVTKMKTDDYSDEVIEEKLDGDTKKFRGRPQDYLRQRIFAHNRAASKNSNIPNGRSKHYRN